MSFNRCKSMKQPVDLKYVTLIDVIDSKVCNTMEENFMNNPLVGVLWNLFSQMIEEYYEVVASFRALGSCTKDSYKLDTDLKNRESPPARPYCIKLPQFELKLFPTHLH